MPDSGSGAYCVPISVPDLSTQITCQGVSQSLIVPIDTNITCTITPMRRRLVVWALPSSFQPTVLPFTDPARSIYGDNPNDASLPMVVTALPSAVLATYNFTVWVRNASGGYYIGSRRSYNQYNLIVSSPPDASSSIHWYVSVIFCLCDHFQKTNSIWTYLLQSSIRAYQLKCFVLD
jgi:hypothetical protein